MSQVLCTTARRALRVRRSLRAKGVGKFRLSVARTNRHVYLQMIDDSVGHTMVFVSTNSKDFKNREVGLKTWGNILCAERLGDLFCSKAVALGIDLKSLPVYFDRGPLSYMGVIKALAESLRKNGLVF